MIEPTDVAKLVIERFSEWKEAVPRLYENDAEFREMCGDYAEASAQLAKWQALTTESAQQTAQYFGFMKVELESEIIEALQRGAYGAE